MSLKSASSWVPETDSAYGWRQRERTWDCDGLVELERGDSVTMQCGCRTRDGSERGNRTGRVQVGEPVQPVGDGTPWPGCPGERWWTLVMRSRANLRKEKLEGLWYSQRHVE